jgi:biopolymer transport protein ExbD
MHPKPFRRSAREPTITLINIVFLMLIFFLVAGSITPARDARLMLVSAADLVATPPPDGLLVLADGSLIFRGALVTAVQAVTVGEPIRIVPDRALPAASLISIGRDLKAAGASDVIIVAERAQP